MEPITADEEWIRETKEEPLECFISLEETMGRWLRYAGGTFIDKGQWRREFLILRHIWEGEV